MTHKMREKKRNDSQDEGEEEERRRGGDQLQLDVVAHGVREP